MTTKTLVLSTEVHTAKDLLSFMQQCAGCNLADLTLTYVVAENEFNRQVTSAGLYEEALTDGSVVYEIRLT